MKTRLLRIIAFVLVLLAAPHAFAAGCTNPGGNTGDIMYSSTLNVMFYCNSSAWVPMGAPASGTITSGTWNGSTVTVPYGGTGDVTLTQNGLLFGNGVGAVGTVAAGSTGQVLVGSTGAAPVFSASPSLTNLTLSGIETLTPGPDYTTTGGQADINLGAHSTVRYNGSAAAVFYGIVAGSSGQILDLQNASNYTLTLSNQSALESTAANKIVTGTGSDLTLASGASVLLQYDGTASLWRVIGGSGSGGSTTGNGTVWQQICSYDVTGSAITSYTFSAANGCAINGDTDGEYQIIGRFENGASSQPSYLVQLNGDTSTGDYGFQYIAGNGSSAIAGNSTSLGGLDFCTPGTSGQVGFCSGLLYAKSGQPRTMISTYSVGVNGSSVGASVLMSSVWSNTSSSVTSLTVQSGLSGGLGVGTHLELWAKRSVGGITGTSTMVANWPDAIRCGVGSSAPTILWLGNQNYSGLTYYYQTGNNTYGITFNASTQAYNSTLGWSQGGSIADCEKSISQIYAEGQAFNFLGSATTSAAAPNMSLQYSNNGVLAGSGVYYNNSNGYVGIGTTTPATTLQVNGTITATTLAGTVSCPSGMIDSGAGYCIDSSDQTETAYGSSMATCAAAGKEVCSFSQLCTAYYRGVGSLSTSTYYRVRDLMFYPGNNTSYLGGGVGANPLNMPSACSSLVPPGPQGSPISFRCCRYKG